jgi:hypothetical protein
MSDATAGYVLEPEAPQGPLTARNLEDFDQCPRKYLLSFLVPRAEGTRFVGAAAALHRAVRDALLEQHAVGGGSEATLREAFARHFDGSACRDSREEEDTRRDGLRMMEAQASQPLLPPGRCDVRLELPLGGHVFVAVADVLSPEPPGVFRLVTARRPPSPGELVDRLSPALLWLAAAGALGDAVTAHVVDLRQGRLLSYRLEAAERGALSARLVSLADRLRREREFAANRGAHCRWCRSQPECPAWKRG